MTTAPWRSRPLTILGSTGSIGTNTLEVAKHLGIPIHTITGHSKVEILAEQVVAYRPKVVVASDPAAIPQLKHLLRNVPVVIEGGSQALVEAARHPDVGTVVTAVVGAAGLPATVAAVAAGKRVGIANKEPLVMAGGLIMAAAARSGAEILPIDSEHSAIFQCLEGHRAHEVDHLILTGSGGPFRTVHDLDGVSISQALKHPTWSMGPKITIDSATLMNKSLEVIEARWLFGVPPERIRVVIHPQSVVHSMVVYRDGSVLAQLGLPDMKVPIQYALTWPEHTAGLTAAPDFARLASLSFEEPDRVRFPSLDMAYAAARDGGLAPTVMNAANEVAVAAFLAGKGRFTDIFRTIERALAQVPRISDPTLDQIIAADADTRARLRP
jgi:1-deoxy-D-xylulose-5-phosphate reductoisomerase